MRAPATRLLFAGLFLTSCSEPIVEAPFDSGGGESHRGESHRDFMVTESSSLTVEMPNYVITFDNTVVCAQTGPDNYHCTAKPDPVRCTKLETK